jgi:hypothetical protein
MPGSPPAGPFVFQLRVVLRGISPLIWRRLLVRNDSSIADLHATLQLALGSQGSWQWERRARAVSADSRCAVHSALGAGQHGD